MTLAPDQLRHLAKLARLKLTDEEIAVFEPQFEHIFAAFEGLNAVDVSGVEALHQPTGLKGVALPDVPRAWVDPADVLASSNQPKAAPQIVVPPPHGTNT